MLERGLVEHHQTYTDIQGDAKDETLYSFARDVKLIIPTTAYFTVEVGHEHLKNGYKVARHNELCVMASNNAWYKMFELMKSKSAYLDHHLSFEFARQNPNFQLVCAEGTHHLHLNHPEVFIEKVNNWIGDTSDRDGNITPKNLMMIRTPAAVVEGLNLSEGYDEMLGEIRMKKKWFTEPFFFQNHFFFKESRFFWRIFGNP